MKMFGPHCPSFRKLAFLVALIVIFCTISNGQSTAFTFQGRLLDNNTPANAAYDIRFLLFDNANTQTGPTISQSGVPVAAGIFTVVLDFGLTAIGDGTFRELEIQIKRPADTSYLTLTPRQELRSVPYAVRSLASDTANVAGGITGILSPLQGGTGIGGSTFPPAGGFLHSSGAGWEISGITAADIPANIQVQAVNLSGVVPVAKGGTGSSTQNFVDLTSNQIIGGNKTINGIFLGDGSGLSGLNGANINSGTITAEKLGTGSVTEDAIRPANVTTEKLADSSVTGLKIADGARGTLKWNVATANIALIPNSGYIVNSPTEIELSLPNSVQIGDVFRITCVGDGGFRVIPSNGQTISVTNGSIPKIPWLPYESPRDWSAIASSSDGTHLIASVGTVGHVNGSLFISTDSGLTWSPRESPRKWSAVASSADGSHLIAADGNGSTNTGFLYVSTNGGGAWTPRETLRNWTGVASSSDGTKLAAVALGSQIYISSDSGVTWSPRESSRSWTSIASSADGSKLIAGERRRVFASSDGGESWGLSLDLSLQNTNVSSVASSADGSRLVAAVAGSGVYVSTDYGATWTPRASNRPWSSVASSADGIRLAAVASGGTTQIFTSNDGGVTWTPTETARDWRAIASSADGEKLFAIADNAPVLVRGRIASTVGGAGGVIGTSSDSLELIYIGGGRFIIIDLQGTLTAF